MKHYLRFLMAFLLALAAIDSARRCDPWLALSLMAAAAYVFAAGTLIGEPPAPSTDETGKRYFNLERRS